MVISAILLAVNHAWLMTSTELTRSRFNLFATPEEWAKSGTQSKDASKEGLQEVKRHHNAHNTGALGAFMSVSLICMFGTISYIVITMLV